MHFPSLISRTRSTGRATLVVAGGSLGGTQALVELVEQLPAELPVPVLVAQHIAPTSRLREILADCTDLAVKWADSTETLRPGHVYLAPPQKHLRLNCHGRACARPGEKVNFACPAVDPLFHSAARYYARRVIAVVLSGRLYDGAAGARAISRAGGAVFVQELATCADPAMPRATMESTPAALMLPPRSIAHAIVSLTMVRGADALLGFDVA